MMPNLPLVLIGENLGQRHRFLNSLVSQTVAGSQVSFEGIEALTEQSAVDRFFKIDCAIKLKNVDYILKNLKDDDMLYVSRVLKCKWLLERRNLINPKYLEDVLFPEMVMPAITKMKHWLYINLTDSLTCEEFYQYYKSIQFDFAVKFLRHCGNEFLLNEFPKILLQLTPHYLKVLGEKNPKLVKIYFDSLATDEELVKRYLRDEQTFYSSIKCLLKSDPDTFLDITERYHSLTSSNKLSPLATEYILRYQKNRFMEKSELYVTHVLHIHTVARQLSVAECQELVIKLARADYLGWWFSYANVEPLVKRVGRDDRAAFKKRVFVAKDVGERVAEWPYALPNSPLEFNVNSDEPHMFQDLEYEPIQLLPHGTTKRKILKKRKGKGCQDCVMMSSSQMKSDLQKLFDEFRFIGFEGTLYELRERLGVASSADRRRDMLLVLVSKSGGRSDSVRALMHLALRLRNEPVHERAAIIRSLVKRAKAWCLPHDVWDMLLEYGHGLGLDGSPSEAQCREGLHAVVLRQLLATGNCEPAVHAAFLEDFSTFEEYKLTVSERSNVAIGLHRILMSAAIHAKPEEAACYLDKLLDVLEKYRVPLESAVTAIAALAESDLEAASSLLMRLYVARAGRRELLRQYLELKYDNDALVNALRHDPGAVISKRLVKLLTEENIRADHFFKKLAVYFTETDGIAKQVQHALQDEIKQKPDVRLARPLAILAGNDFLSLWNQQDLAGSTHYKLAAALRANMHHSRPAPDALALGWRKAGMKAVAWRAMRCPPVKVEQLIYTFLKERVKRPIRLALVLAQRTDCVVDIFSIAATIRPYAALRAALPYYRRLGEVADQQIWDIVKSSISNVNLTARKGLRCILSKVEWVPNTIKADYCAVLYLALEKTGQHTGHIRRALMKYLHLVNDTMLRNVLLRILERMNSEMPEAYPAIVIRYLMLSKSVTDLDSRFEEIGQPFLEKIYAYRDGNDTLGQCFFKQNFNQVMTTILYNSAFFDIKYQCCLAVMERVLSWMNGFLTKDVYFKHYVKIHATMLYFKAVRQSMKQAPESFRVLSNRMSEGVEVIGFTFGRYIVKEVAELKSKYFDSVIELYHNALTDYLTEYFYHSSSRSRFIAAVMKGMLSGSLGNEARLAVNVLNTCLYDLEDTMSAEINELIMKSKEKEMQMFAYARIFN